MRVGLIARSDDRGLGTLSWEFYRAMAPVRTLVIDMTTIARGFVQHPERYPDALVVPWDGGPLPEDQVRGWLHGLDVLYSCETFYDWRILDWAADAGVRTVLHAMPEFYRPISDPSLRIPDETWIPTPWRAEIVGIHSKVLRTVPIPVPDDRLIRPTPAGSPVRVVHIAGHRAAHDRNGTGAFQAAVRRASGPLSVRVECQDARLPALASRPGVAVVQHVGGRADRWAMYADADVLVMPRRYGGLCLPVLEAAASGLAVAMTDAPPQDSWPILRIPARRGGHFRTQGGALDLWDASPTGMTRLLSRLVATPDEVTAAKVRAFEWAHSLRWSVMRPIYEAALERACG